MYHLHKCSIELEYVPVKWKSALVTPIFKEGERELPTNYRPISVIPLCMKILEKYVHDSIDTNVNNNNNILTPDQSGFRKNHSTITAATDLVDNIYLHIDRGMATGIAFLDLRKAFDTVDRKLLLNKLTKILKCKSTINWLSSYLSDRSQSTKVNGVVSENSPTRVHIGTALIYIICE